MPKPTQIAPSLLSADFLNLERDVRLLTESAEPPEWLHLDVMDGHFVRNLTIGPAFVRSLKQITSVPLDVHLMIDNPQYQLDWYLQAGADQLTFHLEALRPGAQAKADALRPGQLGDPRGRSAYLEELSEAEIELGIDLLTAVRSAGSRAGLSINPHTPTELLRPFLGHLDTVLLMSVHPGFGGQDFIPKSFSRLSRVRSDIEAQNAPVLIEVDGGIDATNAQPAVEAGASILVAGKSIYGRANPYQAMQRIRLAASGR